MLAYDIVRLTYDIVCLFSRRRPAVPITLGPPPMPTLHNFQEAIPFLLEAAAQFSDFGHR